MKKGKLTVREFMSRLAERSKNTDPKKDLDVFDIWRKVFDAKDSLKSAKRNDIPAEVKEFYFKECLYFSLPAVFGAGLSIAFVEASIFVLGLVISMICIGILAYSYMSAKAKGIAIRYGHIEDYKKLGGLMGAINRGQDAINPFNFGRGKAGKRYGLNTSKYVIKMDNGAVREVLIPTTDSPIPLGTKVKIYYRKEKNGLNEAIHIEAADSLLLKHFEN